MRQLFFYTLSFCYSMTVNAQVFIDTTVNSSTKKIQTSTNKLSIGSYGEAHYNVPIEKNTLRNGKADLHRVILFIGYQYNKKLQFFTEIEFEHATKIDVEQAFLNYKFNSQINFKTGVLLVPVGMINEFHEPTLFNGVERPSIDTYIIPTTWRELGLGFHGLVKNANFKYQLYVINGFNGYDGTAKFSGKSGIRGGRQNASNAIVRTPSVTGKVTFFGIKDLRIGFSGYFGKSESTLYNGINRDSSFLVAQADSSSIGIALASLNVDYSIGKFKIRGEGIITSLSNIDQYNAFTSSNLGEQIMGYYGELSYKYSLKKKQPYPQLIPFVRYENYDTHYTTSNAITTNKSYSREVLTAGAGLQLSPGTIIKFDYQWLKSGANTRPTGLLNFGFGYWF